MKLPREHPYIKHAENLASVRQGLIQVERLHKHAIRKGDAAATETMARLHTLVVGMMAEAFLRKIIADPHGFNENERSLLRDSRTQLDRWHKAVELAFRRHYAVPVHLALDTTSLPSSVAAQYDRCTALLDKELRPIIEDRNRTAHAQWAWHLNNKETAFVDVAPTPLNYRAIWARGKIILSLGGLVSVLVVSEPTFQRDYGELVEEIDESTDQADGSDYEDFVRFLRQRRRVQS